MASAHNKDRLKTRQNSRRSRKRKRQARLLALVGMGLAVAAVVLLIRYIHQTNLTRAEQKALREMFHSAEPTQQPEATMAAALAESQGPVAAAETPAPAPSPSLQPGQLPVMGEQFLPLMRKNRDVVGWLRYPGITEIDFPVVKRDNTYYLDRDFSGRQNIAGTVFMDEGNSIWPQDENYILHGHNMKNGTMFGKLARMMDPELFRRLPFMQFNTLYQEAQYVPYAVTVFSNDPRDSRFISIISPHFNTRADKESYVATLQQRSSLSFPVDVSPEDQLLTLVTCHGPIDTERLAIGLRALRPGENAEELKAAFMAQVTRQ